MVDAKHSTAETNLSSRQAKSSRHSKICGNFFENLVLYMLSRKGFETALVDHTGIDLIAKNPANKRDYRGISVKGRTRNPGEPAGRVKIENFQDHIKKISDACDADRRAHV